MRHDGIRFARATPIVHGFTLVEIIVALGIFSLLAGAIFFSVEAVTRASGVLTLEQVRSRKIDAFLQWCRRGFRALNARSEILLQTREYGSAGLAVDLIIRKAPGAFSLGDFDSRGPDLTISAVPDGRGGAEVCVARISSEPDLQKCFEQLRSEDWVKLLEDVRLLRWSFWIPEEEKFAEQWPAGRGLPRMLRLQMTLRSGEEIEAVFRTPRLVARGEMPSANPAAEGQSELQLQDPESNPRAQENFIQEVPPFP